MDPQANPLIKRNHSKGIVMEGVVDEYLAPSGTVSLAVNMNFDRIGAAETRPGITLLGAQLVDNHAIKGLFQFLDEGAGTNDQIIAVCNTVAYYLSSGTWTSKRTGLTADTKARFTSFVDFVWMVNGTEATAIWSGAAGDSFVTTGNAASAPTGKFIDNFRTRVFIAGNTTYPSRLYFSSLPTAGVVTWTTSEDYIDISPGDGEDITALKRFNKILLVFKKNFIYPVYSVNQTEPDPGMLVGTYSQESVVLAKDGIYFHHPSGIYRLRPGESQPKEISKPIYDIIKNVTLANYTEVAGWNDDDHVYHHLGNVTVNGVTITNCVARWTISTEVWTLYSYSTPLVVGATYDNATTLVRVVGDSDGNVYTFNSGYTDNGAPIFYRLETQWSDVTGVRTELKSIESMSVLTLNGEGAKWGYKADEDTANVTKPLGTLSSMNTVLEGLKVRGYRIKFILSGANSGSPLVWQGYEIINPISEGIQHEKVSSI